ncbi:MAG: SPOR domain-containing protein [Prevotella sp.]|nr:SPOR domain-containing protein [Prevotella sp.]
MKKSLILSAGLCAVLTLASCGSKESAYRKAYDKAQAAEAEAAANTVQQTATETPAVTPLTPTNPTQPTVDNYDNATYRQEAVTLVSGGGLRNFSVVVGSFSVQANAQGLQNTLKAAGYDAQIVQNSRGMYRVVASTFDRKEDAARSRDAFRSKYPDAWLLYNK